MQMQENTNDVFSSLRLVYNINTNMKQLLNLVLVGYEKLSRPRYVLYKPLP